MFPFLRKTRSAAVLGCGPAGIFATHALIQKGWDVQIFSRLRRSELYGAQYLHQPIPGLTPPDEVPKEVTYLLRGTPDDYRRKVYGARAIEVSPSVMDPVHESWDIRAAYHAGFERYRSLITHMPLIDAEFIRVGLRGREFDWIVSSLPAPAICHDPEHKFDAQDIWAVGDAPERGIFCPVEVAPNFIICDSTPGTGWYRASNVHGYRTAEWPGGKKPPLANIAPVSKPIGTDCDCFTDKSGPSVLRVGRYGRWTKGELSHQAYERAAEL